MIKWGQGTALWPLIMEQTATLTWQQDNGYGGQMSCMTASWRLLHNLAGQIEPLQREFSLLRIMGVPGLTIYHVKSHLQKYRLAKYIPDPSTDENKAEKKDPGDLLAALEGSSAMQISEALKLQMEVQKRLHEQLEVQRQLQLRIEAQGKYLQKIIEEQQRISGAGASRATSSEQLPDSERNNPSTPVPTSESPLQAAPFSKDNVSRVEPMESASHDVPPRGEPVTPDSNCHPGSLTLSPKHEHAAKRQRGSSNGTPIADGDFALPHIFESSKGSEFHQCSIPYSSH